MSKIHLFFTLFTIVTLAACNGTILDQTVVRGSGVLATEERDVPAFTAIRVQSSADVIVKAGDEQRVVASADDNVLPYLRTEVEGDTLVVDFRDDDSTGLSIMDTQHPPQVEVTAPGVVELVTTSSGNITADRLEGERIVLAISSSGDLSVDGVRAETVSIEVSSSGDMEVGLLEAGELDVEMTSSGSVRVAGDVVAQTVRVSSSGDYEAGELRSGEADVELSSSGNATVWVTDRLEADTSSAGKVSYYGNPPAVRGEVTALGGR
jgi:hypothetical protein